MMEISELNKQVISSFVNTFARFSNAKSCLLLAHSEFNLFSEFENTCPNLSINTFKNLIFPNVGTWDIVLADLPLGMRSSSTLLADTGLRTYSLAAIIKSLTFLSDEGYGIFVIEPLSIFSKNQRDNLRCLLKSEGCSVVAVFNTPKDFLPQSALRPLVIVIKKGLENEEFIGELESSEQAELLVEGYFAKKDGHNLSAGIWLSPSSFDGFNKWKIKQQINSLNTEYKTFQSKKLSDIAIAINTCRVGNNYTHIANSIYIPKIGNKPVICDLDKASIKHQNYFQVLCNLELANAEYLAAFFDSKLGRLIIESLFSQSWIPNINKSDISEADIALPSLLIQKEIVNSIKKFHLIREKILSIEENLALNPVSSDALKQIDSMLDVVGELAESDQVKSIIRSGESKQVEFKETLSLDVKAQTKQKYIEDSAIKTIAAFLNSDGGTLLVGVDDAGHIVGISNEINKFHKSNDKFLLHFKNLIKIRIGEEFYPFIDQRLINVDEKLVLKVKCQQSRSEVYVDGNDFYVRTNPATDKLEGPKLVAYIKNHFGQ